MKKFFTKEVLIAIVALVSIAMLYWGINYLKGLNLFTPTNYYKVSYSQVNGLKVSAPVTINGFQVGLVNDISYDYENGNILVELGLDKELKLSVGTKALISTDMLGTSTVVLEMAKHTTEYYNAGDVIQGEVQAGLMDNVTNEIMPSLALMLPKLDSILSNVNYVLSNPALNKAVTRLDMITANLENLSAQLNKNVPNVINNANVITNDLKAVSADLAEMSKELNAVPLDSILDNANVSMANLKTITDKMNNSDSSVGLLLNDKRLYNHADETILSLDSLLKDIKTNPKRYINIKVF